MSMNIINFIFKAKRIRVFLLICGDGLCASGVLYGAAWGYHFFQNDYDVKIYSNLFPFLFLLLIGNILSRSYHGNVFYPGICLNKIDEIRRLTMSILGTYLLLFSWLMFSRQGEMYSRLVLLGSMFITIILMPFIRFILRFLLQHYKLCQINCFIAGAGKTGRLIANELSHSCYYGFKIVGYLDDHVKDREYPDYPCLGKLSQAFHLARYYKVDYCICCLPLSIVNQTFRSYSKIFPHIMFVPDNRMLPISWLRPASIGLYGGFEIKNELLLGIPRLGKRICEVAFAIITILGLIPLLVILAILVKISSPGPIIYRAKRLGYQGKIIHVLKFRTMFSDADQRLKRMLLADQNLAREWQEKFKLSNDPRVTPIGKFLRKTSLDELPQFWNVLTGEMAIIGPRPIVPEEVSYYGDLYELLKRVKPGITGLWQVSGRSDIDYTNRVMLDTYYIINWSVWIDYYIFLKTIFVVIRGKGAC